MDTHAPARQRHLAERFPRHFYTVAHDVVKLTFCIISLDINILIYIERPQYIPTNMAHYKGAATEATRAMNIMKKREKAREELEIKRRKVEDDIKLSTIDNRFATQQSDAIEAQLRSSTVGLVTLDQMRERQMDAVRERERQLAQKDNASGSDKTLDTKSKEQNKKETSKKHKALSFGYDDDSDEDDDDSCSGSSNAEAKQELDGESSSVDQPQDHERPTTKKPALSIKDLDVDTTFLPDREREEEERKLREKLADEWRERQRKLKEEDIEITFSYWDGSGHRRVVRMKKGDSIYQFLQACLETLRKDFSELRSVTADQLMYVKEDLIISHHYTFYDFIVTKARGKSGPLFSFDVHDDVRLTTDASVEKDESHAGKVLLRSWYERNKHIFPASRWEPYDPTRAYEKYTISDKRQ